MQPLSPEVALYADALRSRFENAQPFRHWVVDDFFTPDFAAGLIREFPAFERGNSLNEDGKPGGKSVIEQIRGLGPGFTGLDDLVQSTGFLQWLSQASGIPNLRYDPHYFGGGTHENRHGQDLDPHVDFNRHPVDGSHRRLNLIVYLNPEWQADWGGRLELHSDPRSPDNRIEHIVPAYNRAVLFETTEWSWHGFDRVSLPENRRELSRRSIALYFYTAERPSEELAPSHSTIYVDRPLPERFRAGHQLSEQDVQELKVLLARRDQHNQRLYRELIDAQQRPSFGHETNVGGHFRRFAAGVATVSRSRRLDRDSVRNAFIPFAAALPPGLREPLRQAWRMTTGQRGSGTRAAPTATAMEPPPSPTTDAICPVCAGGSAHLQLVGTVAPTHPAKFSVDRYSLVHCQSCDTIRLHPLPTPEDLKALYEESVQFSDEHYTAAEQVERMLAYYGACLDRFALTPPAGGRCLEVGAGFAWVSRACKQRSSAVETVAQDVTGECAQRCDWVDRYLVGTVDDVPRELSFDLISLTHVIEHLPHPEQMLQDLATRLTNNGRIFITAPYRPAHWQGKDGLDPWLSYSYLHVPAHISYLSERWFQLVAARSGLKLLHWDATQDAHQAFEAILGRG